MKLGFIANSDLPGIAEDCRFAVEHGFEGLEFNYWGNFRDLSAETVRQMRQILDDHGVACSTFGLWGWNHISPNPDERAESLHQLARAIEFAQIIGAPTLITGGGQYSENLHENVAVFADVLRPAINQVKSAGMQLALYGFHGGFLRTADAFATLWQTVPDVGLKFDPANVDHAGEDYIAVLRNYGSRVTHVHIKEHLNHQGDVASQPAAGMGDIHWGKVFAFLYENQYSGHLTIEPHGPIWGQPPLRRTMLLLTQRYIRQFLL